MRDSRSAVSVALVDDDEAVREAVSSLLRSVGYRVFAYASGEDFVRERPAGLQCLVLDAWMPGMSGLQLQAHLLSAGDALPIVFITANANEEERKHAMDAGAVGFLRKPFDEDELLLAIATATRVSPDQ